MTTESYPGELDMLRSLVRTLRMVVRPADASLNEVRRLLWQHASDDGAARNLNPGLTARQARLLEAVRTWGGQWNTCRVLAVYSLTDPEVVQWGTARRDLAALHRAGHLALVDEPNNKHYVLARKGDDA
ncbi:hypothetical protein ACIGZH_01915 [Streptomyces sp. NPDC058319]|uniref:hypothetical protein n=1 Tax=unclassified Streptomyces TaxID=2593676 RepID=UPI0036EC92B8